MPRRTVDSPVGRLTIVEEAGAIARIGWGLAEGADRSDLLDRAAAQLAAYFAGERRDFDLPLRPRGSDFQRRVWAAMSAIPYGRTRTYGELAQESGGVARAVGRACGSNPIPVVIPCHRVLAANGAGGYSGGEGVATKARLLRLEGVMGW